MTIKALIFDLDDTLWPVAPVIMHAEKSLHDWMAQHTPLVPQHYSIEDLRLRRNALVQTDRRFSYDLWALRHALLSRVFAEFDIPACKADEAMQVFAIARNQVQLYPDVMPNLNQWQGKYLMGSISNGFADLEAIGLHRHFPIALAAHRFGCAKPDPKIFLAMIEHLQLPAHEIMYVGDDLVLDVQGAQSVGLSATWLHRGKLHSSGDNSTRSHPSIQPDIVAQDLNELRQKMMAIES